MTKKNRERQYKNFRNAEKNYEAPQHLNKGLTATDTVRKHAKEMADAMLLRNSELEPKPEEVKKDGGQRKKPVTNKV